MKTKIISICILALCMLALSSLAEAQFSYSGSLDLDGSTTGTEDGYLTGTGTWNTGSTTSISWDVSWNGTEQYVHYSYTFTYPSHDPSYFIFEVSQDFTSANITNIKVDGILLPYTDATPQTFTYEVNTFSPDTNNYQTMPESIYGIKIENPQYADPSDGSVTITFDSTRMPTWGDFYARCGVRPEHTSGSTEWNSAWNTGFTTSDTDPSDPASNGSVDGTVTYSHLLVPDTVVVPEPVSSTLFVIGGAFLAGRRLMKKRK